MPVTLRTVDKGSSPLILQAMSCDSGWHTAFSEPLGLAARLRRRLQSGQSTFWVTQAHVWSPEPHLISRVTMGSFAASLLVSWLMKGYNDTYAAGLFGELDGPTGKDVPVQCLHMAAFQRCSFLLPVSLALLVFLLQEQYKYYTIIFFLWKMKNYQ